MILFSNDELFINLDLFVECTLSRVNRLTRLTDECIDALLETRTRRGCYVPDIDEWDWRHLTLC